MGDACGESICMQLGELTVEQLVPEWTGFNGGGVNGKG